MDRDETMRQLLLADGQDMALKAMRLQTAVQVMCYAPGLDYYPDPPSDEDLVDRDHKAAVRAVRIADDLMRLCGLIR
jgi:hypothetical protein